VNGFDPSQPNLSVQQISNPGRRGVTTGRVRKAGTRVYAEIEIGPHDRTYVELEDLELVEAGSEGLHDLLEGLRFGKLGDLARILTYHKISSDLSNVYYSMQASRTDFYAYQFKPVYKFIESLNSRILIADEVGLGKTIEAGLIWLELKARFDAQRLLVICPSMLRDKWKAELKARFNVEAEKYDSQGLIQLLEDFRREEGCFKCAAVCSMQSVRQDVVRQALEDLEKTDCRFDLVVIDEAHHFRNVETKTHQVGKLLSDLTESVALLSATPVHLKSEDLFRLLNILDAGEFGSQWVFEDRLRANEPVVTAQNALRRSPPDVDEARRQLQLLSGSRWFRDNPLIGLAREKLARLTPDDHAGLVETTHLLENLNLFSSVISRTRKREVHEWRVVREPRVLSVKFSPPEAEFYQAVTEAVQRQVGNSIGGSVAALALMMPQRQMASSIPAMVEHYRHRSLFDERPTDDPLGELGFPTGEEGAVPSSRLANVLQQIIDIWPTNTPDSKLAVLVKALGDLFHREPDAKVIIFSYFKKTLVYLQRRLAERGYQAAVIHGDVPTEERQEVINDFRELPSRRVLLSSEVGAEGIDLQFCRVLVNYDLPWNPMKVEQRIGRLDRLGQAADKISVINFSVQGTIEEKILERLYDRIGIFRRSIGDLEPILGEQIQELSRYLLSRVLTPEQVEARVTQTQLALEARRQQEEQLVDQSAAFFGSADYILEQIGQARKLGRWITPDELLAFVKDFFDRAYPGTSVRGDAPEKGLVTIRLSNDARSDLAQFCRVQPSTLRTDLTQPGGEPVLAFRSPAAQSHPRREMLNHFHPLTRWIVDCHRRNSHTFFPTAAVEVDAASPPPGQYLIAVEFWTFHGLRPEVRTAYAISPLGSAQAESKFAAEELMQVILERGRSWEFADRVIDRAALLTAWNRCANQLTAARESAFETFRHKTLMVAQRRKAHLEGYRERKEDALRRAIATAQERGRKGQGIRGFQAQLLKLQEGFDRRMAELETACRTRDEFREVAVVVCQVMK
jgi:superfamily II DNA or RNA helicase